MHQTIQLKRKKKPAADPALQMTSSSFTEIHLLELIKTTFAQKKGIVSKGL